MISNKNKYCFLKFSIYIVCLIFLTNVCVANNNYSFVVGNGSYYYQNDSIIVPYQIKYFTHANDLMLHYLENKIVVKTYNSSGIISKVKTFDINFNISNMKLVALSNFWEDDFLTNYAHDSVIINNFKVFNYIAYQDTINQNNFILNCESNKIKLDFDFINSKFINSLFLKFTGIDSLTKNSDSTVTVYTSNGKIVIEKQLFSLKDTNGVITSNLYLDYIVSNDTLRFFSNSLDTNQSLFTQKKLIYDSKTQTNISGDLGDSKIHRFEVDSDENTYLITSNVQYNNYLPGYNTSFIIDTVRNIEIFRISKTQHINSKSKSKIFGYLFDTIGKTVFTDFKFSKFNNLTLIGYTSNSIEGKFKNIMLDSANSTSFKQFKINSFIAKFDLNCKLLYSNYLNFANEPNIYANSYINEGYSDFIVGFIDSLPNYDSLNIGFVSSSNKNSVGFIQYYNHRNEKSIYSFISSLNINEFTTLSHISSIKTGNSQPQLLISGITNSSGTYFGKNNWNKYNSTNAAFYCTLPLNIDTIYKLMKVDGLGEEGEYNSRNDYHLNRCYSFNNNKVTYMCFLSSSNSFNNIDSVMVSNGKNNDKIVPTVLNVGESLRINKILFLNSDSNHKDLNFDMTIDGFIAVSNSKGRLYYNSSNTISYLDTTYSTSYYNGILAYIDKSLSLTVSNNNVKYSPKYFTYVHGITGDINLKYAKINNRKLYFVGNIKSQNLFTKYNQSVNGNNTNNNWDIQLTGVHMYE